MRPSEPRDTLGPFQLLRIIASDANGTVYEAFDPVLEQRLTLRTFAALTPRGTDRLADLRASVKAGEGPQHPTIVAVHECGWDEGTPFVAMDFVEGESLAQYLARVGRLPVFQGLALASQLLSALEYAHGQGLVHGAIDPQHLLVNRSGRLKITGFGWADLEADGAGRHSPFDVPPYIAPEQILGEPVDHRADLYSAAAVVYELMTGSLPFRTSHDVGAAHAVAAPTWPARAARPDLPIGLDAVFQRALAQEPGTRYQEAAAFQAALEAAIGTPTWVRAVRPAAAGRAKAQFHRHRIRLAAGWVGATGCAAAVVLAVVLGSGPTRVDIPAAHIAPQLQEPQPLAVVASSMQPPVPAPVVEQVEPAAVAQASQVELESGPEPAPTGRSEPRSTVKAKAATASPSLGAPDRQRTAHRPRPPQPESPTASCSNELAFARELCTAFQCATAEFRRHPVCVRMHAQAYARNRLAEPREGP